MILRGIILGLEKYGECSHLIGHHSRRDGDRYVEGDRLAGTESDRVHLRFTERDRDIPAAVRIRGDLDGIVHIIIVRHFDGDRGRAIRELEQVPLVRRNAELLVSWAPIIGGGLILGWE